MLLSKTVIMKWNPANIKHYESKGYPFTKYGDEFLVKVEDLSNGSNVLVNVKCDYEYCENSYFKPMAYNTYNNTIHENGKYYCHKCTMKLFGSEKTRKTKLKNGKSFYDWCYENLSKEEADNIMLRWDYELNVKNGIILSPKDVSCKSVGFNKKGYYFKCLIYPEHASELKSIQNFTYGQKGNLNCNKCNKISVTHNHLLKYLVNKEDAYKYSFGSNKKISMICPNCGYKKEMNLNDLINQGFGCIKCGDSVSFPEKFMFNVLEQLLGNNFKIQLSKTIFNWCNNYRYDFYIDNINCIIETHGLQHYEGNFGKTLEEIQQNDKIKEQLAKSNSIKNYIIIDCRKSELEWIKNSIMESELPKLLNFKEEDIDWLKCHEYACNSLVKVACNYWNNGIKNIPDIMKIMKLGRKVIRKYLKQGTKLDWCDYDPKISLSNKKITYKKVICLTTNEVFDSISEASNKYNINNSCISQCCNKKAKSAGRHPVTNKKMVWMLYDEYLKTI